MGGTKGWTPSVGLLNHPHVPKKLEEKGGAEDPATLDLCTGIPRYSKGDKTFFPFSVIILKILKILPICPEASRSAGRQIGRILSPREDPA